MSPERRDPYGYGAKGERDVTEILRARGWYVLPCCDFVADGIAPHYGGPDGWIVVPDLLVSRGGVTRWVEVKRKGSAMCFRKTLEWWHGLADHRKTQRKLSHYVRTEDASGIPVWICVLEDEIDVDTPCACLDREKDGFGYAARLVADLETLRKPENQRPAMGPAKGEVNFLRDAFSRLEDCF